MKRIAIILAGGSGERFWPLSRRDKPKQFLHLAPGRPTLLEETVDRLKLVLPPEDIYVVTGGHLVERTKASIQDVPAANVLAEPAKRNTAGAIAYAAALLGPDVCMGVFPADHSVGDPKAFVRSVAAAYEHAESTDDLVTIGIEPTRPETGYGYIEVTREADPGVAAPAAAFHEKPDELTALAYLGGRRHLWNAGMFFWSYASYMRELELADADYAAKVVAMTANPSEAASIFGQVPSISIDHLLMERSAHVAVVKGAFDWDDVGALDALARFNRPEADSNTVVLEGGDNLVINEAEGMTVCLLGVSDLVVVTTKDAVLVCHKDKVQSLRDVVSELNKRGMPQV